MVTAAATAGGSAANVTAATAAAGIGTADAAALAAGIAAGVCHEIGELNTGNTVPGGPVAGVTGIAGHKKSSSLKMGNMYSHVILCGRRVFRADYSMVSWVAFIPMVQLSGRKITSPLDTAPFTGGTGWSRRS